MRYSHDIMIDYLYDYYKFEYPDIENERIRKLINVIVMNNKDFISYDEVQAKEDYCARCGWCCRESSPTCQNFKDNKCTAHDSKRQSFLCKQFPWGEYTIYLTINCKYSVRLLKDVIERYLNEYQKSLH